MKQVLWRVYCSFSRKERHGIVLLLTLTIICAGMPVLWEYYVPVEIIKQDSTLLAEVSAFRRALYETTSPVDTISSSDKPVKRFYFDPNTLEATGWRELGVNERTVRTIQRYIAKGGRFRSKEDLLRIYGLPPVLGRELMPYVIIATSGHKWDTGAHRQRQSASATVFQPGKRHLELDINIADSTQWEALPGIGPVLAARIVKFRNMLGGFYEIGQVRETFGLPDSTFNKIQPYLRLYKVSLKKLDINQTDEKSLAQHPYIRYKLARLIILYRSNHGPFSQPKDLLGIPLVDDSIYRKIEHYIKTENSPL